MVSLLFVVLMNGQPNPLAVYHVETFQNKAECLAFKRQIKPIKPIPNSYFSCVNKI